MSCPGEKHHGQQDDNEKDTESDKYLDPDVHNPATRARSPIIGQDSVTRSYNNA